MARLTAKKLCGIWAAVPMPWDEQDRLDEAAYRENIERMCRAGVHGVYTTGSTGEFYALDFEEFTRMVDIQDELCGRYGMPLQIGCAADSTRKTLRLVEYAAARQHVGAVQVTLPYWMELSDREVLRFFQDVYSAFPEMPLVHYNIPRAKRFLQGPDYGRLLQVAPSLIGVKYTFAGSNFAALQQALLLTPQLAYLVAENLLVSAMMLGARGCCSSLVGLNPRFILRLYALAEQRQWEPALALQQTAARFFMELHGLIGELGVESMDPVVDKARNGASLPIRSGSPWKYLSRQGWVNSAYLIVNNVPFRLFVSHRIIIHLFRCRNKGGCIKRKNIAHAVSAHPELRYFSRPPKLKSEEARPVTTTNSASPQWTLQRRHSRHSAQSTSSVNSNFGRTRPVIWCIIRILKQR